MATPQIQTDIQPQLIPTNAGGRSFAAPPKALQEAVTPTELFYVRNHWKGAPPIDPMTYRLSVGGEVQTALSLSMDDILAMPKRTFQVTLECCGNGSVPDPWARMTRSAMEKVTGNGIMGNASWAGVALADILGRAGINSDAVEVMFEGADHGADEIEGGPLEVTYERSLPIKKALHPDTLLAYEMNGEALIPLHGYPLRLIVPGWYGMSSIKWLVGIHVLDHTFDGFYQTERYMIVNGPDADSFYTYLTKMRVKSIITSPMPGEEVAPGDYLVSGAAWSGEEEIVRVEVSADGGSTWHDARIMLPENSYTWSRWEYLWQVPGPGQYVLMSKATNSLGETQPMEFPNIWDGRSYGNNMVFSHPVEVVS